MRGLRKEACIIVIILCCVLLCGCFNNSIKEDGVKEALADIDPEEGAAKNVSATLYYRLENEEYLVGIVRDVMVRENERTEYALLRTLIGGVPDPDDELEQLFSASVTVTEITIEGGIIYVTLSNKFLDETEYNREVQIAEQEYNSAIKTNGKSETELAAARDKRIEAAEANMYLKRRLGYYSIVNTLSGYGDGILVICEVEDSVGTANRITNKQLGIEYDQQADSDLVEAAQFNQSVVATPERMIDIAIGYITAEQYERAYNCFYFDQGTKVNIGSFSAFAKSLGTIEACEFTGTNDEQSLDSATVSVEFTKTGSAKTAADISLIKDVNVYKIDFSSFEKAFG